MLDLSTLSIEEVVGQLHAVEQRRKTKASKDHGSCLLLTEEEWIARMKSRDGGSSSGGRSRGGKKPSRGPTRLKEKKVSSSETGSDDVCGYCGKKGNLKKDCRKKKRDEEAHLAQKEDDEQGLLLVHDIVIDAAHPDLPSAATRSVTSFPQRHVEMEE